MYLKKIFFEKIAIAVVVPLMGSGHTNSAAHFSVLNMVTFLFF